MIQHTLYYIYDPMCSWCYAFAPTFNEVKKNLASNIKVVYVPGGLAPHNKEPMSQNMRDKIQNIWHEITYGVGTKFNHDFWKNNIAYRSTYLSCQATLAARTQGKEYEMIKAIQKGYYQDALNPSLKEDLIKMAKDIDFDLEQFSKEFISKEFELMLKEELDLRRKLNIRNFPSLVIKYKKETYPINISFNEPQKILAQIEDLTTNIYF